jgi:hypothetical protein
MDRLEVKEFCDLAFAAFPGLNEWLQTRSTDIYKTYEAWQKTLSSVTYSDAVLVLDGWLDGTIKDPPVGYRRELFAIDIRATVQRWKDDARRAASHDELMQKANYGKYTRNKGIVAIAPYLERIIEIGDKIKNNELEENEGSTLINAIVSEGCDAIDAKKSKYNS